jgi:hypothetical protein
MEEGKNPFKLLTGKLNPQKRDFLEGLGKDGSSISEWILKK